MINSINTLELGESECPDLVGKKQSTKIDLIEATHDRKINLIGNFR